MKDYERYMDAIIKQMLDYSAMDFKNTIYIDENDDVDDLVKTVAVGVNFLGEEIEQQFKELNQKQEIIINALKEKELLLSEIHHRVKNNLQVLVNVLNFNENLPPESRESFGDIAKRVKGMSRIQEIIYKHDDLVNMDLGTYCMNLCNMLSSIYTEDEVILEYDMNPGLFVDMEKARHIGSFVNEAIINCYKHLFISSGGSIKVSLKKISDLYIIEIEGYSKNKSELKSSNSLGQKLMEAFTKQLKGKLEKNANNGYTVKLSFPNS